MTSPQSAAHAWLEGELRLSGVDQRMIVLLKAISETGSISQAARECGLSYKGAWQIIERANNSAPKILVSTAIGGNKGGGTCLTETGKRLLALYELLQGKHQNFLRDLNQELLDDPDTRILLQHLAVKTSAINQLFGTVAAVRVGAVNAEIDIKLDENTIIKVTLALSKLSELALKAGVDAVLLINSNAILISPKLADYQYTASNCLPCIVLRVHFDAINAEIIVQLKNGETLSCVITKESAKVMGLTKDVEAWVIFNANSPILGIRG